MMSGIRNNPPSITSSSLQLLEQAQSKVQSVSEKLSSAQPMLGSLQNPPTQITSTRPLNSEVEISPIRTLDLAKAATEQVISKIIHAAGIALLSQAENLSETVSRLLD